MEPLGGGIWGGVVAPLGCAYVGFLVMFFVYRRSPKARRRASGPAPGWPVLLRHLGSMAAAGYLIFLAIVLVFSFVFADQARAIRQALTEGGFIAFVGLAGLASLGWVEGQVRRRTRPH
ncbi:MAG: DUF6256 family protein [Actinomycetota bacterium]